MGGYIGSGIGTVANAAERKQTYSITTATTSLTGLAYTPTKVHVFHNGVRLVDGTDYSATNGTSITLTNAAQNGDEVVVISYPSFQTSDTVSAANGGTFAGNVAMSGTLDVTGATTLAGQLNTGSILPSTDNASDLGSTSKRFQDLHLSGGVSFDEDPSLVTGSVSSKTLDDYEEGTFTPSFGYSTNGTHSSTFGEQFGYYTKIGRVVHCSVFLNWSSFSKGTASGGAQILNLPFTSLSSSRSMGSGGWQAYNYNADTSKQFTFVVQAGNTHIDLADVGANTLNDQINDPNSGTEFKIFVTYFTS
jgi:hypothetical protein